MVMEKIFSSDDFYRSRHNIWMITQTLARGKFSSNPVICWHDVASIIKRNECNMYWVEQIMKYPLDSAHTSTAGVLCHVAVCLCLLTHAVYVWVLL